MVVFLGNPEIKSRPRTSIVGSPCPLEYGAAEPIPILIRSAISSPIAMLYVDFM